MTTTPDPRTVRTDREQAREIILGHAKDVEYGSIGEYLADFDEFSSLPEDEFAHLQGRIDKQIRNATVAVSWPDEQPQDEQELAWHGLRLFSGPALIDDGDVEQHELTHPAQCSTLPPGAACWAERQPFRWWWPTAHGTYRIRPEDLSPLGGDGPDYQMTLRVQVLKAGEWFEYTNDVVGPDPTDETPAIVERLKVALAEKAEQPQDDGDVRIAQLESERARYRIAWRMARQRAKVAGWAADKYAKRSHDLHEAAMDLIGENLELKFFGPEAVAAADVAPQQPERRLCSCGCHPGGDCSACSGWHAGGGSQQPARDTADGGAE